MQKHATGSNSLSSPEQQDQYVTKQAGAHPPGTLTHDPITSVEGSGFLFTGTGGLFQPQDRGVWEHSCSETCSPTRPSSSLAPHQAISQKHASKFSICLSVLKPTAVQTVLHPLWKVHSWVSESLSSPSSILL